MSVLDLNVLMSAGLGEDAKRLVQDFLELQGLHRRATEELGRLNIAYETERQRAEHFKACYEENLAFQKKVKDWLRLIPFGER